MPGPVVFDQFHVTLLRPDPLDEPTATAARTALDRPSFLDAVRAAVRQLLDADPALAVLDAVVSG